MFQAVLAHGVIECLAVAPEEHAFFTAAFLSVCANPSFDWMITAW